MINIFCGIVGTATGQSWWLGYADDLLFAAMVDGKRRRWKPCSKTMDKARYEELSKREFYN